MKQTFFQKRIFSLDRLRNINRFFNDIDGDENFDYIIFLFDNEHLLWN